MNRGVTPIVVCAVIALSAGPAGAVEIETVTVGDPRNVGLVQDYFVLGDVTYRYMIGKYEVTARQYAEFLNAVAAADPCELYDTRMWTNATGCKIERSGAPGSYSYGVAANQADRPVNYVSYWDACRFANWLHNGQPSGTQGTGTTERGAYTLDGYNGNDGRTIARNAGWRWAVTSEDEWFKAAYYKAGSTDAGYWLYPTGSDDRPSNRLIDPDPGNNATFYADGYTIGTPYRTEVGAHENSASSYGTFDQGGNVGEWCEEVPYVGYAFRRVRGGRFNTTFESMSALSRSYDSPGDAESHAGFRVVTVMACEPPGSIQASPVRILRGESSVLSILSTNEGDRVEWFRDRCWHDGDNFIGAEDSVAVTPSVSTTYFARTRNDNCPDEYCSEVTVIVYYPPDYDGDGDVDQVDLIWFSDCMSGFGVPVSGDCASSDFDANGYVDQSDFGMFQRCLGASSDPYDVNCLAGPGQ